MCLAELGEFVAAGVAAEEAFRLADVIDQPLPRSWAGYLVGEAYILQGDLNRAIAVLEHAVEVAQASELPMYVDLAGADLGYAYVLTGRVRDGLALLEAAVRSQDARRYVLQQARRIGLLGEALVFDGRWHEAERAGRRAVELARRCGERGSEAYALRLLGDVAAHGEPTNGGQAAVQYHDALALAEELGMRPLQARCHLGLGKLYRRVGCYDEARTELSTAVAMLREMGIAHWLPEAERELAQDDRSVSGNTS